MDAPDLDWPRMSLRACAVIAAVLAAGSANAAIDPMSPDCPDYRQVSEYRQRIEAVPAADGLALIDRYMRDLDSPYLCGTGELERLREARELALVTFAGDGWALHPQSAYACDRYDRRTTTCNGVYADGTSFPHTAGIAFHPLAERLAGRIEQAIPGWRLEAVYRLSPSDLQNGKWPTRLPAAGGRVAVSPTDRQDALVAMFRVPLPRRHRKLVWYFTTGPLVAPAAAR